MSICHQDAEAEQLMTLQNMLLYFDSELLEQLQCHPTRAFGAGGPRANIPAQYGSDVGGIR